MKPFEYIIAGVVGDLPYCAIRVEVPWAVRRNIPACAIPLLHIRIAAPPRAIVWPLDVAPMYQQGLVWWNRNGIPLCFLQGDAPVYHDLNINHNRQDSRKRHLEGSEINAIVV